MVAIDAVPRIELYRGATWCYFFAVARQLVLGVSQHLERFVIVGGGVLHVGPIHVMKAQGRVVNHRLLLRRG